MKAEKIVINVVGGADCPCGLVDACATVSNKLLMESGENVQDDGDLGTAQSTRLGESASAVRTASCAGSCKSRTVEV